MTTIHQLDEITINQIAAGEIVGSLTACLKELIENSIDAQATTILIKVEKGNSIFIHDDGIGMGREDALLCLERHATSKIKTVEDLQMVHTMGFRGEALAAISSVSKMHLNTSLKKSGVGVAIYAEGGKVISTKPSAPIEGTLIEIEDLFFNTPARKKYQKSPRVVHASIQKLVRSLSICYLDTSFTLFIEGTKVFNCINHPKVSLEEKFFERSTSLFSQEFYENALYLNKSWSGGKICGLIGPQTITRPNRQMQQIFVNKRKISSDWISSAIKEGFNTSIDKDRYPLCCLHLEIDPTQIDINIHPQKKVLEFKEPTRIFDQIASLIANRLSKQRKDSARFVQASYQHTASFKNRLYAQQEADWESSDLFPKQINILFSFGSYALIAKDPEDLNEEGCLLCDLKAAHRKVCFDFWQNKEAATLEPLLFPIPLELSFTEAEKIRTYQKEFEKLGIEIVAAGPQSFFIQTLPSIFTEKDIKEFVHSLLEDPPFQKKEALNAICQTASRVKRFSEEEKKSLIFSLLSCKSDLHCPLGKPIFAFLGEREAKKIMAQ